MFDELVVEQYRLTFHKENLHLLKVLRGSGALTVKNLERIRVANRRREREYALVGKSPLVAELDGRVMGMLQDSIRMQ